MTTWEEAKAILHAKYPKVKEEYDKLGPRYEIISALWKARQRQGLTQTEVGRRMGVRQHVVSRLESALHSPRLDTLVAYASALGLDLKVTLTPGAHARSARSKTASSRRQSNGKRRRVA